MNEPGSNPDIPEIADVIFQEVWDRTNPGTKRKLAFLQLSNGGRLTVFPHQEWDAPVGEARQVVLYPVQKAAVAAPVGGIPVGERLGARRQGAHLDNVDGETTVVPGRENFNEALEAVDAAFRGMDDTMGRMDEALTRLTNAVNAAKEVTDSR